MATNAAPIIVRRKKGGEHAAHHGGAWKVAYADFVTAMMAFFLLLWLLSAAYLVDRTTWVEFIERIEDFGEQNKDLTFDVTGPWPAYDFVRVIS